MGGCAGQHSQMLGLNFSSLDSASSSLLPNYLPLGPLKLVFLLDT